MLHQSPRTPYRPRRFFCLRRKSPLGSLHDRFWDVRLHHRSADADVLQPVPGFRQTRGQRYSGPFHGRLGHRQVRGQPSQSILCLSPSPVSHIENIKIFPNHCQTDADKTAPDTALPLLAHRAFQAANSRLGPQVKAGRAGTHLSAQSGLAGERRRRLFLKKYECLKSFVFKGLRAFPPTASKKIKNGVDEGTQIGYILMQKSSIRL
jgi:hypothetical protein